MIRTDAVQPAAKVLIAAAALALLTASAIHFGMPIRVGDTTLVDPFPGAAPPETVLGIALLAGLGVATVTRRSSAIPLATTLFAIVVTLYGLSVTITSGREGDVAYHVVLLSMLLAAAVILAVGDGSHLQNGRVALRAVTLLYGLVFLAAAIQNAGARVTIGPIDWYFASPVIQAAVGEAIIGAGLLAAGISLRRQYVSIAYGLSIFGITFGLLSQRVVGAPREIHVLLVPLGVVGLTLLWSTGRGRSGGRGADDHGAARQRPASGAAGRAEETS